MTFSLCQLPMFFGMFHIQYNIPKGTKRRLRCLGKMVVFVEEQCFVSIALESVVFGKVTAALVASLDSLRSRSESSKATSVGHMVNRLQMCIFKQFSFCLFILREQSECTGNFVSMMFMMIVKR